MSGQWEQFVEAAAEPLDPDVFDQSDPQHDHWAMDLRREIARDRARKMLAVVGPLIAEDTRVRMVEAAAEIVKREGVEDVRAKVAEEIAAKLDQRAKDALDRAVRWTEGTEGMTQEALTGLATGYDRGAYEARLAAKAEA